MKVPSVINGFILYQINQTALNSGYNFTTYGKFTDTSSITRKRQTTRFEPLRQKCADSRPHSGCRVGWVYF